jgi:hypothetical protein
MKTNVTTLKAQSSKLKTSSKDQTPKTKCRWRARFGAWSFGWLLSLMLCGLSFRANAVLPEPDNVIFGTITRNGTPVTAADYDVVVEVRRTPAGPAIASYTMGSNLRLGFLYAVRVKLESLTPLLDANATQTNDQVYLVVSDFNGELYSTNVVIGPRGTFRQINLGPAPSGDSDGDGLPDAWELAKFGNLNNGPGSLGGNGQTALSNYLTGSDPNNPNDVFRLSISQSGPGRFVGFFARQAAGPGYEGLNRHYGLEYTTNVAIAPWVPVRNYTNILGNNTTVSYPTTEIFPNVIYRGHVRLCRP